MRATARVASPLTDGAAREVPVEVEVTDPQGAAVFRARVSMWVSPRPPR